MAPQHHIIFFHGIPGSPADLELLRAANPGKDIIVLDLLSDTVSLDIERFVDAGDSLEFVGFSLGAMFALKYAARYPEAVTLLTLISPAAPLSLGNFLPDMAGRTVFQFAMRHPKLLRRLISFQGLIARFVPKFILSLLFAKCGASEKRLAGQPDVQQILRSGLQHSYVDNPARVCEILTDYVADWSPTLLKVTCEIRIIQGSNDTWTPPKMARALQETIGQNARIEILDGLEHYGTLKQARLR